MKSIKKIKSSIFARQMSIAKISLKSGMNIINSFREDDLKDKFKTLFKDNIDSITGELHLMKGPIMKAGQMLSMYAGEILPEDARALLKTLENQSFFLEWEEISKELPQEILEKIEFEKEALAAASLGQVHKGTIKETGEIIVTKIQYRGVRKAIDNDVRALKLLLSTLNLLPKTDNLTEIFNEIKSMLKRETDYFLEQESLMKYQENLGDNEFFYIPKVYPELSAKNFITFEFVDGVELRHEDFMNLEQDFKNKVGEKFLELFLKEVFVWNLAQTDAHLGNYIFDPKRKKIALIDFGACKSANDDFLKGYKKILTAAYTHNKELFFDACKDLKYFDLETSDNDILWEYFSLVGEPFLSGGSYNWGESEIPDKVLKKLPKVLKEVKLKSPPGDGVFIDRKVAGVFFFLKHLNARVNNKNLFERYLPDNY